MPVTESLLASYFNIVRKTFLDLVPKTIMAFMVNNVTGKSFLWVESPVTCHLSCSALWYSESLQSELVKYLYEESKFDELLKETDDVAERR